MSGDSSTPGRALFPEYHRIHGMYEREVEGLTDGQMDTLQPEKSWGIWPIRRQVSHIASVHYRWFLQTWGETLFGENPPRDISLTDTGGTDRYLDPKRFHEMPDLLTALKDATALALEILGGETLGSLREKTLTRRIDPNDTFATGENRLEWTKNVTLKAHSSGYWQDENDPGLFHFDLEYTFRHILWEAYAHLKTIQAHKKAMGLGVRVDIPEVGYLKYLKWE
jgi:hypothetical protein